MAELVSKDSIQLLSTTQVNINDDQNELNFIEVRILTYMDIPINMRLSLLHAESL